jgi:PAS domain S-box-containing protein
MKHSVSRTALLYAILTGLWILGLDLLSDSLATGRPHFVQLHAVVAIFSVLLLYLLLSRELRARERMEQALRQAHDELELRVQERTEELGVANQELRAEIATRVRTEAEREGLLTQIEQERRRVEELAGALARERDMLRVIMENTYAQLVYLDPDFNFVQFNTPYVEGSGRSREELVGRNHFELFPNQENQAIFERARDTGQPVAFHAKPFEYVHQPERGITFWDWTLAPVKGEDDHVHGLVFSLVDVTQRVRAEEELRAALEAARRRQTESALSWPIATSRIRHAPYLTRARTCSEPRLATSPCWRKTEPRTK